MPVGLINGTAGVLTRARARRRELRKRKQESAELSLRERSPSFLLTDEELRLSTELVKLPDLDQQARLRHDYCVLLRQVAAFDTTGCIERSLSNKRLSSQDIPASREETGSSTQRTDGEQQPSPSKSRPPDANETPSSLVAEQEEDTPEDQGGLLDQKWSMGQAWIKRNVDSHLLRSTWALHLNLEEGTLDKHALFCLRETNSLRRFCLWFIKLPAFETFILVVIALNCIMMAVDQADSSRNFRRAFAICQETFLYIFVVEIILKVIANGLICGPKTYLRDHWNKLDALIVATDLVVLILNQLEPCEVQGLLACSEIQGNVANLSVLRAIRVLRPFRSINRFNHMKFLVKRLLQSLPELFDSVILLGFGLMLFSIVSVQLYSGAFLQKCVDPLTGKLQPEEIDGKPTSNLCRPGSNYGDTWGSCEKGFVCRKGVGHNPNSGITSFDNLASASLTIFQAITLEGWAPLMYDVRQTNGLGHDLFFIVLVVFGALFMMNLVVAVLVSNFDGVEDDVISMKSQAISTVSTTPETETPLEKLEHKLHCVQQYFFKISESRRFGNLILVLILLNTVALGLDNVVEDAILDKVNIVFTVVFAVEMFIKLIGLGFTGYWRDPYNQFDGIIVLISLVDIFITALGTDFSGHFIIIRSFRLMRIFKLSRRMRSLARVLHAVRESLVHIRDLGFLMLLFMFVCALMGTSFFSSKDESLANSRWSYIPDGYYKGELVRPNFSSFWSAMVTIFIVVTGENWNDIMYIGVHKNGWFCSIFFMIIVIIGNYIILNLFLAILVDSFEKDELEDQGLSTKSDLALKSPSRGTSSTKSLRQSTSRKPTLRKRSSDSWLVTGKSLNFFSADNPVRLYAFRTVRHPHFESFTYLLIAVSSVILAMDAPDELDPDRQHLFRVMDCVLTGFFILEALAKIVALGFLCGQTSYLQDPWNILDFLVVLISVVNLVMRETGSGEEMAWVKSLRALRALRPLRMVSRNEGLKAVVMSIIAAVPAIMEVLLVLLLFLVIFSILGVQFFKNKFTRCSCMEWCPMRKYNPLSSLAADRPSEQLCSGECMDAPLHARTCRWERHPHYSFDNTMRAILTLFEVSTLEMWPDVMWLGVDGVSEDEAPSYNHSPLAAVFFIIFISVMTFFIINLFVGVVIDKFTMVRNELNGLLILSERQQLWVKTQKKLLKVQPRPLLTPPDDKWRQLALQLVSLPQFDLLIAGLILANVAVMCTDYEGASPSIENIQENANVVFLGVFTLEAVLKLYALHFRLYFRDLWNVFDFFVVVISFATSSPTLAEFVSIDTTIFRTVRVVRMLRLLKSFTTLRKLFETLVLSLPSLMNIGLMLLLLFYVYSVAGMALFGDIEVDNNPYQLYLNKDVNFRSFYLTMVTMLRMSTGESWNGIMHDCFSGALCANKVDDFSCGSTPIAIVFFVSFMLIGSFVFLNLFIAVIIQNLFESEDFAELTESIRITDADLEKFVESWSRLAPDGNSYIETRKLKRLLMEVDAPLGFRNEMLVGHLMLRVIDRLGIRDYDGYVHFAETLWCLAACVDGADMSGDAADFEVQRNLNRMITRALPVPSREKARRGMMLYKASEVLAALELQSSWKARKQQQAFHNILSSIGHDDAHTLSNKGALVLAALGGGRTAALVKASRKAPALSACKEGDESITNDNTLAEGNGIMPRTASRSASRSDRSQSTPLDRSQSTPLEFNDPRIVDTSLPSVLRQSPNAVCGANEIVPDIDQSDSGICPVCFSACTYEKIPGDASSVVQVMGQNPTTIEARGGGQLPPSLTADEMDSTQTGLAPALAEIVPHMTLYSDDHFIQVVTRESSRASRQRVTYQV